jgi:NADPH-dependent glutamate synthase beta subunit-like oxidoreductase
VSADHILFAAGRIPELVFVPFAETEEEQAPQETTGDTIRWEAFAPYKQPAYHKESGLMSKGDVMTDFSAAIKAIAAGRRAAASVHKAIYAITADLPENVVTPDTPVQNIDRVFHVPANRRQTMPLADANQLSRGSELEMGYSAQSAKQEADRCLQCGLICYLHTTESGQDQTAATGT